MLSIPSHSVRVRMLSFPEKANSPTVRTPPGTITLSKSRQSANTLFSNDCKLSESSKLFKEEQYAKAYAPISVTESGISADKSAVQP